MMDIPFPSERPPPQPKSQDPSAAGREVGDDGGGQPDEGQLA